MPYDYTRTRSALPTADRLWEIRNRRGLDCLLAEFNADPQMRADEHLRNALLGLALEGHDLEAVRVFAELGADLVPVAADRMNSAAGRGDAATVDELIALGANVNFCDECGFSPLDSALENLAEMDALRMVEHLVARGADIECRCHFNGTALHSAALWGRTKVVEFLLSRGARAAVEDVDEDTPRDFALQQSNRTISSLLLGPEMAERKGAGHPIEFEHLTEATALLRFVEGRLARGEPCGTLPDGYLDELRLRIEAHTRGDIRAYRLVSWYQRGRYALLEAGVPV